jgi:hypothetical protein
MLKTCLKRWKMDISVTKRVIVMRRLFLILFVLDGILTLNVGIFFVCAAFGES